MIILDPLSIALSVVHDAITLVSAGSLSDFTMMSTNSNLISRACHQPSTCQVSRRLVPSHRAGYGSRLSFSGHPKRQRLPFLFVAHECVVRLDFWDLSHSLFFRCFVTVLCWLPSLDAMSAPTAERKVRHHVFSSFLFAQLSRIAVSRYLLLSKLVLFHPLPLFLWLLVFDVAHFLDLRDAYFFSCFILCFVSQHSRISSTSGARWPHDKRSSLVCVWLVEPHIFSSLSNQLVRPSAPQTRFSCCSLEFSGQRSNTTMFSSSTVAFTEVF